MADIDKDLEKEIDEVEKEALQKCEVNKNLEEEILTELEGQRNFPSNTFLLLAYCGYSFLLVFISMICKLFSCKFYYCEKHTSCICNGFSIFNLSNS